MRAVTVLLVTLLASAFHGVKKYDTGSGTVYKLGMKQDVTLERGSKNFNYLEHLIVSGLVCLKTFLVVVQHRR